MHHFILTINHPSGIAWRYKMGNHANLIRVHTQEKEKRLDPMRID